MPIEISQDEPLTLRQVQEAAWLKSGLPPATGPRFPVVSLTATVDEAEDIKHLLCALRASNIAALLFIKPPAERLSESQLGSLLRLLRDWDQLTLHNVLQLEQSGLPKESLGLFQIEARTEIRWMREWLMASFDSRIAKYPSLPWRSFIRKIVSENYEFAQNLSLFGKEVEADPKPLHDLIRAFLIAKKKTVCVFPKHWGKVQ